MKKTLLLFSLLIAVSFSLDKITIPYDFNTVSSGKRAYLADNYDEVEDKTNYLIDSTQQLRDIFSGYLSDLVLTSQDNFTVQLDEDGDGDKSFIVLSDGGDTLLKVSEDSTGYVILGTITADSLNVNGTTINNLGVVYSPFGYKLDAGQGLGLPSGVPNIYVNSDNQWSFSDTLFSRANFDAYDVHVNNNTVLDGGLTVDTDLLFVDASANKIGFGNNAPVGNYGFGASNELYITSNIINAAGETNGNAELVLNEAGYDNGYGQFRDLNIKDGKNSSIAFFDGSTGDIGIGTMSPSGKLGIGTNNQIYITTTSINARGETNGNAELVLNEAGYDNGYGQFRDLNIKDGKNSSIAFFDGSTGDFGMGTVLPDAKLHILDGTGGVFVAGNNPTLILQDTSSSGPEINFVGPSDGIINLNFGDVDNYDETQISVAPINKSFAVIVNENNALSIDSNAVVTLGSTGAGVVALGDYLRLPVKTDTGDPSSPTDGWMYVNTLDNKVRVYADGAWRDLATW